MRKTAMKNTTVQLPSDTLKYLRLIAQKEGRSLAGQVRFFLAEAVTRNNTENQEKP
jgi:hypothetical protein